MPSLPTKRKWPNPEEGDLTWACPNPQTSTEDSPCRPVHLWDSTRISPMTPPIEFTTKGKNVWLEVPITTSSQGYTISFPSRTEISLSYREITGWPDNTDKKDSATSDQPEKHCWSQRSETPLFYTEIWGGSTCGSPFTSSGSRNRDRGSPRGTGQTKQIKIIPQGFRN